MDEYGGLGSIKEKQLLKTVAMLETMLVQTGLSDEEKLSVLKNTLFSDLLSLSRKDTKKHLQAQNLVKTLDAQIRRVQDVAIFCIAMKYIVCPMNHAIDAVPSDDLAFSKKAAQNILDTLGETKAGLVIATWDKLGTSGCLDAERSIVVSEFSVLNDRLPHFSVAHGKLDDYIVLTAFVQEFERRLGQKRKSRGGGSLEAVTDFLFDYYHFRSSPAPSHFDQDLEVDKWFQCKDGWTIGISCKRTLRERWKQVSQADRGTLSHFKIKELWHLLTYDGDLSDDKIVRLGEQGQVFYLMDESPVYQRCAAHVGMKDYVRPLSGLIGDIRRNAK